MQRRLPRQRGDEAVRAPARTGSPSYAVPAHPARTVAADRSFHGSIIPRGKSDSAAGSATDGATLATAPRSSAACSAGPRVAVDPDAPAATRRPDIALGPAAFGSATRPFAQQLAADFSPIARRLGQRRTFDASATAERVLGRRASLCVARDWRQRLRGSRGTGLGADAGLQR